MIASFEYQVSRDEFVVGLRTLTEELARVDVNGRRRVWEQLGVVTTALIITGYIFPYQLTGLLAFIVLVCLFEVALRARWARRSIGVSYDPSLGPARVEVDDAGITETVLQRRRQWQWGSVRNVHDRGGAVVIQFAGWDMIVLPSRLWEDRSGQQDFLAAVSGHAHITPARAAGSREPSAPMEREYVLLASVGGGADAAFLVLWSIQPLLSSQAAAAGRSWVVTGALAVVLPLAAAIAGFFASRAALQLLQQLSPLAPKLTAMCLIWAIPAYIAIEAFALF